MAQSFEKLFETKLILAIEKHVIPQLHEEMALAGATATAPSHHAALDHKLDGPEIKTIASICLAEALEEQITDWGDDVNRDVYVNDIKEALVNFNADVAFEKGGWNILFRSLTKRLAGFNKNARDTINQVGDAEQCKVILGYNNTKANLTPFNDNNSNINLQKSTYPGNPGQIFGDAAASNNYKQTNPLHNGTCYICGKFLYKGDGKEPISLEEAKVLDAGQGGHTVMECEHILAFMAGIVLYGVYNVKKEVLSDAELEHLKSEYFWAHRCCNQKKTDIPLVTFDSSVAAQYIVNGDNVRKMIMAIKNGGTTDLDVECVKLIETTLDANNAIARINDPDSIAGKKLQIITNFANRKLNERAATLQINDVLDVPRDIYAVAILMDSCGTKVLNAAFQTNEHKKALVDMSTKAEEVFQKFTDECDILNATMQALANANVNPYNARGTERRMADMIPARQQAKEEAIRKYKEFLTSIIGKGEAFKIYEYENLDQCKEAIQAMIDATKKMANETAKSYHSLNGQNGGGKRKNRPPAVSKTEDDEKFWLALQKALGGFVQCLQELKRIQAGFPETWGKICGHGELARIAHNDGEWEGDPPTMADATFFEQYLSNKLLGSLVNKTLLKVSNGWQNLRTLIRSDPVKEITRLRVGYAEAPALRGLGPRADQEGAVLLGRGPPAEGVDGLAKLAGLKSQRSARTPFPRMATKMGFPMKTTLRPRTTTSQVLHRGHVNSKGGGRRKTMKRKTRKRKPNRRKTRKRKLGRKSIKKRK